MNNYHSDALFAFTNLMHFRASCCSIAINDFNVTLKKLVFETVQNVFTPFLLRADTPDDRYMLSYLFRQFLIKILFIGGQFIPVFVS